MKIKQVVPLGFSLVFVLVSVNAIAEEWGNRISKEARNWVIHTYEVKLNLRLLEKNLVDAQTGERGFLLTGNETFLELYYQAQVLAPEYLRNLESRMATIPSQMQRLSELRVLQNSKFEDLRTTIQLKQAGQEEAVINAVSSEMGNQIMNQIRAKIAEMATVEDELLAEREETVKRIEFWISFMNWFGLLITIGVGSLVSWMVSKVIMRPIEEVTDAIASSSAEIATAAAQHESLANHQASSIHQTTSTIDELSASARKCAEQAENALTEAQQTLKLAAQGKEVVEKNRLSLTQLKQQIATITAQIEQLKENTDQISNIAGVVTDIAAQTNMLALNASVEAVRAREYGKGFNVVASEIRKLADQSKQSAAKINTLATTIQGAISSTIIVMNQGVQTIGTGVNLGEETATVFVQVADAVENIVVSNQHISSTTVQQSIAIQQVVEATNSINDATVQTVSGITQTKTSTEQLNAAAQNLQNLI
ncbi:CHASE3 domain-containing protein [Spirulina subsalsa FACHB-351]|uniref:CHASE3 domain-containing protein n=1 Tax=Spirulina subsalsa FACHB-351 TaxID=234711 RepID=A0ABT3L8V9_9CYAN|nr:methyl-accepting chemotaxis protein [Spirulina subsalsa]MCW6037946.1 CHASE3 domain-containing protein [Spirulina subsalsa FACHB-351]